MRGHALHRPQHTPAASSTNLFTWLHPASPSHESAAPAWPGKLGLHQSLYFSALQWRACLQAWLQAAFTTKLAHESPHPCPCCCCCRHAIPFQCGGLCLHASNDKPSCACMHVEQSREGGRPRRAWVLHIRWSMQRGAAHPAGTAATPHQPHVPGGIAAHQTQRPRQLRFFRPPLSCGATGTGTGAGTHVFANAQALRPAPRRFCLVTWMQASAGAGALWSWSKSAMSGSNAARLVRPVLLPVIFSIHVGPSNWHCHSGLAN